MDYVCPTLLCWLLSDFVNRICLIFYSQQLVWILKHFQILSPLIVHLEFFFLKIVCFFFYKWNQHLSYLDLFLGIFAFIMTGQIIIQEVPVPEIPARKWSGRERGGRIRTWLILKLGFELGTPVAQQRCMSACCPQGYRCRQFKHFFRFV